MPRLRTLSPIWPAGRLQNGKRWIENHVHRWTALLELNGLRFLTDPTFDTAGTEYATGLYTLRKTAGPAARRDNIEPLDAVLLAAKVLTTVPGAERLGGRAVGSSPWQTTEISSPKRGVVRIMATPGRHGPAQGERGPVTGFVLISEEQPHQAVHVSGDTVWYEDVAEIARRFPVHVALLFMGAARIYEVGPHHLTFTAAEGVQAAPAFARATIVPVHFEDARLRYRLRLLAPGVAADFSA